jgi:RES domain-containing protein
MSPKLPSISGTFYRIVHAGNAAAPLAGAVTPEGRFHHDGQAALYMSSSPAWALKAVEAYLKPGDPPRMIFPLSLQPARVVDLRDLQLCDQLGIDPADAAIPWLPQRAEELSASTWRASDASRRSGADGMIYTARSAPERWHLVLFRWNEPGAPSVSVAGAPETLSLQ